jgi:hypothetical protein
LTPIETTARDSSSAPDEKLTAFLELEKLALSSKAGHAATLWKRDG